MGYRSAKVTGQDPVKGEPSSPLASVEFFASITIDNLAVGQHRSKRHVKTPKCRLCQRVDHWLAIVQTKQ